MFRKVKEVENSDKYSFNGKGYSRIFILEKDKGKENQILKLLENFDKEEWDFYFGLEGYMRNNYVTLWDENEPTIELYYTHKFSIERVSEFVKLCKDELDADVLIKFKHRTSDDEDNVIRVHV